MDNETVACSQLITKHFALDEVELQAALSWSSLKSRLSPIIRDLLDHDLNRLLNVFYKIDISEEQFKMILSCSPADQLADKLADLVIEREMLKMETRRKYR